MITNHKSRYTVFLFFLLGLTVAVAYVIVIDIFAQQRTDTVSLSHLATIISSATSIFAVIYLIKTYESQKKELGLTVEAFKEQGKTQSVQRFESSFFNMLTLFQEIIRFMGQPITREVKGRDESGERFERSETINATGKEFIRTVHEEFKKDFLIELDKKSSSVIFKHRLGKDEPAANRIKTISAKVKIRLSQLRRVSKSYPVKYYEKHCYEDYKSSLGHYFRYLYNILKFCITNSDREDIPKYIGMIQAQMSNEELGLLMYNVLSVHGLSQSKKQKFYIWLEYYHFLQNMDSSALLLDHHHDLFPYTVFKFLNTDQEKLKEEKRQQWLATLDHDSFNIPAGS